MGADINIYVVVFKEAGCQRSRCGEHQSVSEGDVRGNFSFSVLLNLLGIAFMHDFLRGAFKERAVRILEEGGKIEFIMP